MADLYNQVLVGDGVSTYTVGANNRKTGVTSEMGTPRLTPLVIYNDGDYYFYESEFDDPNSKQFQIIQTLQQFVEIYTIGEVDDYDFTVLVRDSSIPYNDGDTFEDDGSEVDILQDAIRALGSDFEDHTVTIGEIDGDDTDG
jgi:hypothetical protein